MCQIVRYKKMSVFSPTLIPSTCVYVHYYRRSIYCCLIVDYTSLISKGLLSLSLSTLVLCHSEIKGISGDKNWPITGLQRLTLKSTVNDHPVSKSYSTVNHYLIFFKYITEPNYLSHLLSHTEPSILLWIVQEWM